MTMTIDEAVAQIPPGWELRLMNWEGPVDETPRDFEVELLQRATDWHVPGKGAVLVDAVLDALAKIVPSPP